MNDSEKLSEASITRIIAPEPAAREDLSRGGVSNVRRLLARPHR